MLNKMQNVRLAAETPLCSHLAACPGCPSYGQPSEDKPGLAHLRRVADRGGVDLIVTSGPAFGYRHRARLAVRGRSQSPKVGVFAAGTHRIVDIPNCPVHHPAINRVAKALKTVVRKFGWVPYREQGHRGSVRYLQVVIRPSDGLAQVVVVSNDESSALLMPGLLALVDEVGDGLHSLFWNRQTSQGNAVLGEIFEHLHGPPSLHQEVGGIRACFPPGAFSQANMPLFLAAVNTIQEFVPSGSRVVEFYAGVGAISLGLASQSARVMCNEIGQGSLHGLAQGRDGLPADTANKVVICPGTAESCVAELARADIAIVDPPRKGLCEGLVSAFNVTPVRRLAYLSCGLESFIRDAGLLAVGGYRLQHLEAFDFFPNTEHLETLALFTHEGSI